MAVSRPPLPGSTNLPVSDWRYDADFRWPDRVPWSQLGPDFHMTFGRSDPADPQPENLEVFGQNGSGKTHAAGKIYQERAFVTGRASVLLSHKAVDQTLAKIGWPIAHTWDQMQKLARDGYINVIFQPVTRLMGDARDAFYDAELTGALDRLWASTGSGDPADTDIIVDDWAYAEELPELKGRLRQFLREGRSNGFSTGALKQRPQGGTRLTSSETQWSLGFKPKDDDDLERWAQLFGARRQWMPVMRSLDREKREFIVRHAVSGDAYITWIDEPLKPIMPPRRRRTLRDRLRFG